jgi:peroxiredoxin
LIFNFIFYFFFFSIFQRDHFKDLQAVGVKAVFGLSTQDSEYQKEARDRLHLPFEILSDEKLEWTKALNLPTFTVEGMTLLKRMALIITNGMIQKVFYPVFPPDTNAVQVLEYLKTN